MAGSASNGRYRVRVMFLDRRTGLTLPVGAPFVDDSRYAQCLLGSGVIEPEPPTKTLPEAMLDIFPPDRFVDDTVAIIAGGESVKTEKNLPLLKDISVIAINDAYKLYPDADILYGADHTWWQHPNHDYVADFPGERWTQNKGAGDWPRVAKEHGIHVIKSRGDITSLSTDPGLIHTGVNSAFQALNLAVLGGAKKVLLIGVDLAGKHWFGDHPDTLNRPSPFGVMKEAFENIVPQLKELGVEVINCSRKSELTCYPKKTIRAALK